MRRAAPKLSIVQSQRIADLPRLRPLRARQARTFLATPALRGRLAAFVARHVDGRVAVLVARALLETGGRRAVVVRADAHGRVTDVALAPELPIGRLPRLLAPLRAEGYRVRHVRPADARRALNGLEAGRKSRADGLEAALALCVARAG